MTKVTKVRLAWKYRKQLWRYRGLIRHRKDLAVIAAFGTAIAVAAFSRRQRENG